MLDSLQSPVAQHYLSQLAATSTKYQSVTKRPLSLLLSGLPKPDEGRFYMTNGFMASANPSQKQPDMMRIEINRNDIKNFRTDIKDGTIADYGAAEITSSTMYRNEISELNLQLATITDLTIRNNNVKNKPGYADNADVATSIVTSPQIQLPSIAIDKAQFHLYRESLEKQKKAMPIDVVARDRDMRERIAKLTPLQVVNKMNAELTKKRLDSYASDTQFALIIDKEGNVTQKEGIPRSSGKFEELQSMPKLDKDDPKYGIMPRTNALFPENSVKIRDDFVRQRLKEAFPNQEKSIGVEYIKFDAKVKSDATGKIVNVTHYKPHFFVVK